MSSIDSLLGELNETIEVSFRRYYNHHQLELYNKKIECFKGFGDRPIDYYECFDRVERQTLKDLQDSKAAYQELQDEYKICRFDCKSLPQKELQACVKKCQNDVQNSALQFYRNFFRSKITKQDFQRLKKLTKVQK